MKIKIHLIKFNLKNYLIVIIMFENTYLFKAPRDDRIYRRISRKTRKFEYNIVYSR